MRQCCILHTLCQACTVPGCHYLYPFLDLSVLSKQAPSPQGETWLHHVLQAPAPPKEPAKEEPPKFSAFQGKARTLKG